MADDKLVLDIQANVANALAGLTAVQAHLKELAAPAVAGGMSGGAAALTAGVNNMATSLTGKLRDALAISGGHLKGWAEVGLKGVEGLKAGLEGLGKLLINPMNFLAGAIGIGIVAEMIHGVTTLDDQIYALSRVMNENTRAASTWLAVGNMLGVQAESITVGFRYMSQHIDQNAKVLRDMGIATQDAQGHLLPLLDVVQESRTWFQNHENSTLAAARAVELFGRGGMALLPILQSSDAAFAALSKEAENLGLVMDTKTLEASRRMEAQIKLAEEAFHGAALAVGRAFMPALAELAVILNKLVIQSLPAITAAVTRFASFLVGFLSAITGIPLAFTDADKAMADFSGTALDAGNQSDTLAAANQGAANAAKALTDATKDTVQALNDQISAIDAADKAFQDSINDQIKALQDQQKAENFGDQQDKLKAQKSEKDKEIAKLDSEYKQDILDGDFLAAATVLDQLTKAQDESANLQRQIDKGASDYKKNNAIEALQLVAEARRQDDQTKADALRKEIKAVQDAAAAQQAAMQSAAAGMAGAISGAASNMTSSIAGAGASIKDILDKTGMDAGTKFADKLMAHNWKGLGEMIGDSIGNALLAAIGNAISRGASNYNHAVDDWAGRVIRDLGHDLQASGNPIEIVIGDALASYNPKPSFGGGGVVPGPIGAPMIAQIHGGETVFTPDQMKALTGGSFGRGGGSGQQVTINELNVLAPVSGTPDDLARAIRRELQGALGRK